MGFGVPLIIPDTTADARVRRSSAWLVRASNAALAWAMTDSTGVGVPLTIELALYIVSNIPTPNLELTYAEEASAYFSDTTLAMFSVAPFSSPWTAADAAASTLEYCSAATLVALSTFP